VTAAEAEALFGKMLNGDMTNAEIADTLITVADRGETADDIVGAARAMRARMIPIKAPANAIDVCGTGGDGQHSLNVSTAVSIVVAACGVPVAKHGNRAASSKAGGADTLEALGLNLDRASEAAEETLADLGIAFLFAQKHHPALARIAPIRKALGRRTIFNLLGPLCNPAGVARQLVGVPSPKLIRVFSEALFQLDSGVAAMVVSGDEGLDEISISSTSRIEGFGGGLSLAFAGPNRHHPSRSDLDLAFKLLPYNEWGLTPEDAGLPRHPAEALKGGDAAFNAAALRRLLDGEKGAYRDAVLLNAAGALIVAGEVNSWKDGVEEAAEAIDRGLAKALLDCWIAY
jgi:anthranilate phosphoribosyltransferase